MSEDVDRGGQVVCEVASQFQQESLARQTTPEHQGLVGCVRIPAAARMAEVGRGVGGSGGSGGRAAWNSDDADRGRGR